MNCVACIPQNQHAAAIITPKMYQTRGQKPRLPVTPNYVEKLDAPGADRKQLGCRYDANEGSKPTFLSELRLVCVDIRLEIHFHHRKRAKEGMLRQCCGVCRSYSSGSLGFVEPAMRRLYGAFSDPAFSRFISNRALISADLALISADIALVSTDLALISAVC